MPSSNLCAKANTRLKEGVSPDSKEQKNLFFAAGKLGAFDDVALHEQKHEDKRSHADRRRRK